MRKSLWYVNQQHATNYQVGRVLCGGDAVHRHPPSSGLGSNTSVQDAFNLAWKVAFVVKGHAGPGLLDSYTPERAPVGKQIVARANQSRKDYAGLREWFDRDSDDPVRDGLAKLKEASPEGVAPPRAALRGAGAEEHRVQRARGRAQPALRVRCRRARPDRRRRRSGRGTASSTCRPPPGPGAKLPHAWLVGRDRQPRLDPRRRRQGQADPAHRPRRAGLEARGAEAGPAVPAHGRGRRARHHRPLRLLARRPGDRRSRSDPGPPRRLRRLAAPPSGTTTRRCASSATRSRPSWPSRSTADRRTGRARVQHPSVRSPCRRPRPRPTTSGV